jgi:arsenic resistance protein ArsH
LSEFEQILPNIRTEAFERPDRSMLGEPLRSTHKPRILLLYGSVRPRSYSRFLTQEAARLLEHFGAEPCIYDPGGLPLPDDAPEDHPKVRELRELVAWSEGQVWSSPERHGAMSGILKSQIDWIPLNSGAMRPTQGKTLAVMQVSGGSQSFNAVNQMRVLGRWMRMLTIPNQSSVAKAFQEFDEAGRMKPSSFYDRVVDVMEELVKFTLLTRDVSHHLTDRYSERVETAAELSARVNLQAAVDVARPKEACGCSPTPQSTTLQSTTCRQSTE